MKPEELKSQVLGILATIAPDDLSEIERVMNDVARCATEAPATPRHDRTPA